MHLPIFYDVILDGILLILALSVIFLIYIDRKVNVLSKRLFIAVILGVSFGFLFRFAREHSIETGPIIDGFLSIVAGAYLALLQMLVVPLVLFSIINSILHFTTLAQSQQLSRISFRSISLLLIMTSIASGIAMLLTKYWQVGAGLDFSQIHYQPKHEYDSIVDNILGLFPSNPLKAMVDGNTIAVAIFAVIIALSALALHKTEPEAVERFKHVITSIFAVIKQMTRFVVRLTPYGVFALIASLVASNGLETFAALSQYVGVIFVAMICVFLMHTLINWVVNGYSPLHYFRLAYTPLIVAFTTRSSFGTLPVTEQTLTQKFRVHQLTASFVPSVAATLGMNACAGVFPGMVIAMTLIALGQPITGLIIVKVMLVSAIASLGVSGIPGTAFVAASAALNLLGLPYFILGVVQSVDPIVDMGRTATNVNGAMTSALFADRASRQT